MMEKVKLLRLLYLLEIDTNKVTLFFSDTTHDYHTICTIRLLIILFIMILKLRTPEHDEKDALLTDRSSIFLWSNPDLYYRAIEFSLLLQCVYIALWCTNFAVIALPSETPAQWEILLLIPVPLNFYILKLVLNFACVLRSASELDEEIAVKICEDAADERVVTQRLRTMVRAALLDIEPNKASWPLFLCELFSYHIPENKGGLPKKPFKVFLHGLKIYLSENSVHKIFKVIDFDHNGFISYSEFFDIVFPELPRPAEQETKVTLSSLRSRVPSVMHLDNITREPSVMCSEIPSVHSSHDQVRVGQSSMHGMSVVDQDASDLGPDLDSNALLQLRSIQDLHPLPSESALYRIRGQDKGQG
jgi:hypothetical protein